MPAWKAHLVPHRDAVGEVLPEVAHPFALEELVGIPLGEAGKNAVFVLREGSVGLKHTPDRHAEEQDEKDDENGAIGNGMRRLFLDFVHAASDQKIKYRKGL